MDSWKRPPGRPPGPPPVPARDYLRPQVPPPSGATPGQNFLDAPRPSTAPPFRVPDIPTMTTENIFSSAISTAEPSQLFRRTNSHPVKMPQFYKQQGPIETNAFYGNLLVEPQNLPVWTHPYSVWNCQDPQFKGLAISHIGNKQKVFGPEPNSNPARFFFNPVGICSMMLSATEFESQNTFLVGECKRFSTGIKYQTSSGGSLSSTLVQGMGFISGLYEGQITPQISSKVGIQDVGFAGCSEGINKYFISLFDSTKWLVYTTLSNLHQIDANHLVGQRTQRAQDVVQIAKLTGSDSTSYDVTAGCYATGMNLHSSFTQSSKVIYNFQYELQGSSSSQSSIFWALPHQYATFTDQMNRCGTNLTLDSTVKGPMKAYVTQKFEMAVDMPPLSLGTDPWSEFSPQCNNNIPSNTYELIEQVATHEVNTFDVANVSNTDSMYTAGKILDKAAYMLYVVAFMLKNQQLTQTLLEKLKTAYKRFSSNTQQEPLVYDTNWKGLVSTSGMDGNFYKDFGNTFYNDHHFHYGYHIHTAAIIGLVDKKYGNGSWINENREYVETLIRDVSNPSPSDPYFPQFRSFDWYNGHSWANGLFGSGDGKDQESTSEDYNYSYALRTWGHVTNNPQLFQLGSLMLAVSKGSIQNYFLLERTNTIQPSQFIGNKVTGILFENKIDHVTYFGLNKEYIHGIHMIPITPASSFVRKSSYVKEEWQDSGLDELVRTVDDGWKGILMLNYALADPKAAYAFFSAADFQEKWLDNGMSRTWCIAFCAGIGGC